MNPWIVAAGYALAIFGTLVILIWIGLSTIS